MGQRYNIMGGATSCINDMGPRATGAPPCITIVLLTGLYLTKEPQRNFDTGPTQNLLCQI
ncbi:UNVERIFIED_CONTAM: hypothetical protein NCL1_50145 [Trichonephila clavipes]